MYTKQEVIINSFRDGKSQRQIARDMQISRKTVKKYIQEHEALLQSAVCTETAQATNLSSKPTYNMTVPRHKFKLTIEVQEWLDSILRKLNATKQQGTGKSADELMIEEKEALSKHPASVMICSEQIQLRVDKYSTVCYKGNRYSVPDHLVGQFVDMSVRSREIHIYSQNKRVAIHDRSYKPHAWVIEIEHYLDSFKKKPGTLARSQALASNHYLRDLYIKFFQHEPREFIELLSYCQNQMVSEEKLEVSVKRLLDSCGDNVTVEKLRALLGNKPTLTSIIEREDNIALKAKEQLSWITALTHKTNNNGQYQSTNNRI